mgnify:CR=1 FL=1
MNARVLSVEPWFNAMNNRVHAVEPWFNAKYTKVHEHFRIHVHEKSRSVYTRSHEARTRTFTSLPAPHVTPRRGIVVKKCQVSVLPTWHSSHRVRVAIGTGRRSHISKLTLSVIMAVMT